MNPALEKLARIAAVEFSQIVVDSVVMGEKLRLFLSDSSFVDAWVSRVMEGRFGFHWERRHLDDTFYRYDNFPDTAWKTVKTYPRHFHNGAQENIEAATFSADVTEGFRDFLRFVEEKIKPS